MDVIERHKLTEEQLDRMINVLASLLLDFVDAQTAEMLLRANGFENEELKAIGFDVEIS